MLSLVVIYYPIYSVIKNHMSDLLVASALGRHEHHCSRFNILQNKMLNLKQKIQPACLVREDGGAERDRTVDPLLAKQVLSQLSYSPI